MLEREYHAFLVISGTFFLLDLVGSSFAEGRWYLDYGWFSFFLAGLVSFVTLRVLKKHTTLLHVEGR